MFAFRGEKAIYGEQIMTRRDEGCEIGRLSAQPRDERDERREKEPMDGTVRKTR